MDTKVENWEIIRTCYFFSDLEGTVTDQETRLTAAEENIQGKNTIYDIFFFYNGHIWKLANVVKYRVCIFLMLSDCRSADDRC